MTLTAEPRVRQTPRSARPATDAPVVAAPAPTAAAPARLALTATLVRDDVYRVLDGPRTIGYVQVAGRVFVTLLGEVYNTSCEIAQCLDLESAVGRLERHRE